MNAKAIGQAMKARRIKKSGYEVREGVRPCVRMPKHTQGAYAERIGVNLRTYQAWEGGEQIPGRQWDAGIVRVFGVTVNQLEREGLR